jgi:hypothetical protein
MDSFLITGSTGLTGKPANLELRLALEPNLRRKPSRAMVRSSYRGILAYNHLEIQVADQSVRFLLTQTL